MIPMMMAAALHAYSFEADFVEGCSCKNACSFEISGKNPGCSAAGFYVFRSGSYRGKSLTGGKAAFVAGAAGWIRLYFDGPTQIVRAATRDFIRDALADWGKPEALDWRPVEVTNLGSDYIALVDNGRILELQTEGVTPPQVYDRIFNVGLHPVIHQGHTLQCRFGDGSRKLTFSNSNGFFNSKVVASGKLR